MAGHVRREAFFGNQVLLEGLHVHVPRSRVRLRHHGGGYTGGIAEILHSRLHADGGDGVPMGTDGDAHDEDAVQTLG